MLEFQNLIEETRVRTINEIAQRQEQDYRSLNDIISSVASKINPNTVLTPSEPGMIEKIIRSPEKTSYVWDPRPSPGTRLTSWESVNFNSVEAYTSYCIRMIGSYKSSENAEVRTISYGLLNPNQQNFFSSLHGNNIPVDANFLVLLTKNDTIPLCHESWL
jgi:hypothetical protein